MAQIIILGAIGNTPRQNRDDMRVLSGGGQIYTLKSHIDKVHPLVLKKWKSEIYSEDERIRDANGKTIEDYLYKAKDGEMYGIFKLSPRECLRLMDVRDEDIDKMFAVNSNSQCYKQAGNSIVVACLSAIFSQLHIQGIKSWNERTLEEKKPY